MKKVEYQCNLCFKQRVMFIPENIGFRVDTRGLMDLIDIHSCKDSKENAILLHVDPDLNVRTQIPVVRAQQKSDVPGLPLPSPKKVERTQIDIVSDHLTRVKRIDYLKINDKIRNKEFIFDQLTNKDIEKVKIVEQFIEIEVASEKPIPNGKILQWIKALKTAYEKAVYIDEKTIDSVLKFIDKEIEEEVTNKDLVALELIINGINSIPQLIKDDETIDVEFSDLDIVERRNLYSIVEISKDNEKFNVLQMYEKLKSNFSFIDYIFNLTMLIEKEIIKISMVQFVDK